jgi:putative transposase
MHFELNQVYHIYNRGNNKQQIFFLESDYLLFLQKIKTQIFPYCDILCWCLMPNHFHLLISANTLSCIERNAFGNTSMQELSYRIGILLSSYSQIKNKQNGTTGSLFQQKTKSKKLNSEGLTNWKSINNHYLVSCMHYIHQNPLFAGLVNKLEDWNFSSFKDYAGLRDGKLCNKKILLELTDYELSTFYQDSYHVISNGKMFFENE